jgi:ferredoxin
MEGATLGSHEVTFRTRRGERTVQVAGQTLLQAAREAKLPLDSLCERGVCGTCKVRLCSGAVEANSSLALSEQEREGGYVLACVSRPTRAAVVDLEPERSRPAPPRLGRPSAGAA